LKTAQETMKRDYDSKMREVEYQPGDFVYVLDTAHIKGRAKKLDPPPMERPGNCSEKIITLHIQSQVCKCSLVYDDRLYLRGIQPGTSGTLVLVNCFS
jgi:hypothetical protein